MLQGLSPYVEYLDTELRPELIDIFEVLDDDHRINLSNSPSSDVEKRKIKVMTYNLLTPI